MQRRCPKAAPQRWHRPPRAAPWRRRAAAAMTTVSQSSQVFLPIPEAKRHANDVEHATELLHVVRNEL